uniref:Toll like receptor 8 n=1 Tax=Anabas testudineus TaxID=64144 RepID=A0A3Q1IGH5_ANATE
MKYIFLPTIFGGNLTLHAACKLVWWSPQFPCDVTSNDSNVIFDCRGRHLELVPHGITSNATWLDLSENLIKNISIDSFSHLSNLTTLDLSWANNKKRYPLKIDAKAFQNLTKLSHLKLTGNHLNEIPRNIPVSVKILELNINHIVLLDNRSFAGLANLTELWISKNCYTGNPCNKPVTIMEGSFAIMLKLKVLDLSFNNLTQVPKGLPKSIIVLKLGSNKIEHISEVDFLGLHYLEILTIQRNCPRCEIAPYPCVPCPNRSVTIQPNAFDHLTKLQVLHLGGNSLDHLNPSWFQKLKNLKELYLSFNFLLKAITEEATFLNYLPKLEILDLSFNYELKIYPTTLNLSQEFSKLQSLRTLNLQGLVFQNIEQSTFKPLYELKNLSALNLGTNFIIHSDATIFSRLPHLKMIYLAENRLYPFPEKNPPQLCAGNIQRSDFSIAPLLKPYPNDFVYEISHNLIKKECIDSGKMLILSSNNLFFISPKLFEGYGNVACLNLSGNGFSAALNGTEFSSLPNLTYLDLSNNKLDLAFDNAFKELKKLQVLDLSYNSHYFKAYGLLHNLNFLKNLPNLRVLNMSHNFISTLLTKQMHSRSLAELQFTNNNLGNLWKHRDGSYKMLFTNLINLTILDISHNSIAKIPDNVYGHLPRNLTLLRIGHNSLTDFNWGQLKGFHQLQILDLSFNKLSNVTGMNLNIIHTLTFLDLSHNTIFHLDNGFINGLGSLKTLSLSSNKLTIIDQSTNASQPNPHIQTLFLQKNPFECTCVSVEFIMWLESCGIKIPRLATDVTCDTPANNRGQLLITFDINQCVNDSKAFMGYTLTTSFIIIFMFVTTVAHLFYWDASYLIHYTKAKLKGYKSLKPLDNIHNVFVTYDTGDPHVSEWVMKNLRVKLEEEGGLPLCLEERDWSPGIPLVDNLTQSIRYSRKTLFVLTEGYVKTGVFKLAMYLAHQRLLDENVDVIVLLMLDPVLQHSHFLRLRRRLCGKSVVEWPRTWPTNPQAQTYFQFSVRSILASESHKQYNNLFKQTQ